jgi:hypothetical protein
MGRHELITNKPRFSRGEVVFLAFAMNEEIPQFGDYSDIPTL